MSELNLTSSNTTIASLDVKDMYPSIKYKLVLAAISPTTVRTFTRKRKTKSVQPWKC